ncbi:hypothetical protein V8G54_035095 [Vigna mungo]|uniref:Uncharacterized protein n=1 Tax=Vigna mungo TaxID=3915 RepID=A0AAQ3MEE5_VIGMU
MTIIKQIRKQTLVTRNRFSNSPTVDPIHPTHHHIPLRPIHVLCDPNHHVGTQHTCGEVYHILNGPHAPLRLTLARCSLALAHRIHHDLLQTRTNTNPKNPVHPVNGKR